MNKAILLFVLIIWSVSCKYADKQNEKPITSASEPVDLVEPLVDAANSRWFFFNSATRPFGMVNLSPDMVLNGAWSAGYRYNEDTIRAFSHIHAWQLSGIPVLPTTGSFKGHLGSNMYGSRYSHEKEIAKAGYHQIYLEDYGVNAELTSTTRVGFHRYTFPESDQSHIHLDLSTVLGPCDTRKGLVRLVNEQELEGYALMGSTRRRPKDTYVFYVIQFDEPFEKAGAWRKGELQGALEEIEGEQIGAFVSFGTEEGEKRLMKVGISYVSVEQARLNLETELSHWDFDRVAAESRSDWNQWLSKIKVEGGSQEEQRRFYTDLWHALQGRRIISDANGKYCDMTGPERRIGQIPLTENGKPRFNHYNSDSFWGAQWTLNSLWHLVYPKVTEEFVNSMLLMYSDGGLIPRGPSGGNYTFVMTGASSTPFIVSAYMKGIRGFNVEKAYEGLRKNHMPGGIMGKAGYEHKTNTGGGLNYYLQRGHIPHPLPVRGRGYHEDGPAQTLEYAYQDWTLAQFAKALGKQDDYNMFLKRAGNYKNVWNADLNSMWVKRVDGSWAEPVDRLLYDNGWVEGNASQYTWWVPHDVQGLIELVGGREAFNEKLNASFEKAQKHGFVAAKSHDAGETRENRRVHINYGNQPCMQTAFLFNYSGAPWRTQYWSRKIIEAVYSGVSPQEGYSGDEDQGLMGSLAVLMKMGLFSMHGGTNMEPLYEIVSPVFDKITIELDADYYPGGNFVIETTGNGADNLYIQSASLDGKPLNKAWFYHKDLIDGGSLKLEMGPKPNKDWGSRAEDAPPSMEK